MEAQQKYKYHYRPGFNSNNLLLEFFSGVDSDKFLTDLLNSIEEIHPKLANLKDFWMNDEIVLEVQSNIGDFTLSKDIWGLAFIMAENNQQELKK